MTYEETPKDAIFAQAPGPGSMAACDMNIVLLGSFPYPHGMAVTRHAELLLKGLKDVPGVSLRVVILRQSSQGNAPSGSHQGILYETVAPDSFRVKAVLTAPWWYARAARVVRRAFQPGRKNILLVYDPPCWENLPVVWQARRLGFKVVFFIMEDNDLASRISSSVWHRVKNALTRHATRQTPQVANGLAVISSHLETKFRALTAGRVPIHHLPILVDMARYPEQPRLFGDTITLLYCGSFGVKDGVPVLLDAFDRLAGRFENLRLVLTGKGPREVMQPVLARIGASPYRGRIRYLGCLDENAYYATLNAADIPCMTRVNTGYANAGFPFKLGEFLATGKPTIASRVSDVERLLEDRRDAMLVRPDNSEDVISAVEYLVTDAKRAASIGLRGRKKACQRFDYQSQSEAFLRFMAGLWDGNGAEEKETLA